MVTDVDVEKLQRVLRSHGVVFALMFGSRALGTNGPDADLDLGVWGADTDLFALSAALDSFTPRIDLLDLATAPLRISGRVANQGIPLLDDDPPIRVRWVAQTRSRAADDRLRRERFDREFLDAVVAGDRG